MVMVTLLDFGVMQSSALPWVCTVKQGKSRAEGRLVNGAICIVNGIYTLVKKEQFQCKQPCSAKQNPHSWKATDAPATLLTGMLVSSKDGRCYGRIKWDGANEQ
jgi:hypothetical protein